MSYKVEGCDEIKSFYSSTVRIGTIDGYIYGENIGVDDNIIYFNKEDSSSIHVSAYQPIKNGRYVLYKNLYNRPEYILRIVNNINIPNSIIGMKGGRVSLVPNTETGRNDPNNRWMFIPSGNKFKIVSSPDSVFGDMYLSVDKQDISRLENDKRMCSELQTLDDMEEQLEKVLSKYPSWANTDGIVGAIDDLFGGMTDEERAELRNWKDTYEKNLDRYNALKKVHKLCNGSLLNLNISIGLTPTEFIINDINVQLEDVNNVPFSTLESKVVDEMNLVSSYPLEQVIEICKSGEDLIKNGEIIDNKMEIITDWVFSEAGLINQFVIIGMFVVAVIICIIIGFVYKYFMKKRNLKNKRI